MKSIRAFAFLLAATLLTLTMLTGGASAQSRLSLEGGGLFPLGTMGDDVDVSPYLGATFELQDVNALGQTALLGVFLRGAYAPLTVKDEAKTIYNDDSSSYFEAAIGVKAYSKAAPFYITVQGGYANYSPPGLGSKNGLATGLGLGLDFGGPAIHVSLEGRANYAFMQDIDNISFLTTTAAIGFPF